MTDFGTPINGITDCARVEPGSPWENGYYENFNGELRDEYLNGEIFTRLREAQIAIGK